MITIRIRCSAMVMVRHIMNFTGSNEFIRKFLLSGEAMLANTYAKVYYRGGGWYTVSGYSADGSDVHSVINSINELKARGAVLKEGGYYFDEVGDICGTYEEDYVRTPIEDFVF
jgi:hypothetical protein